MDTEQSNGDQDNLIATIPTKTNRPTKGQVDNEVESIYSAMVDQEVVSSSMLLGRRLSTGEVIDARS